MTPEDIIDSQLENLQQRWEDDPSPHLSLQLADLYRKRGRLGDALPVLEKGLAAHPRHVSVRVALGRYRLEGENPKGAEEALLAVVEEDPAHLVANKLLVRTYLALGDRQRAADRLDLYCVLNDSDPEIETLRAALTGSATATTATEPVGEPFAAAAGALGASVDLTSVRPPGRRVLIGARERPPFDLLLSLPLEPSPLSEIFGSFDDALDGPLEAPPAELAETSSTADEISPEFVDALIEYEPELEAPRLETESRGAEEAEADLQPREVDGGSGATATLGALYLAQDHLDDAQATFEQVLERDPEDAEARAGLAEVTSRRAVAEGAKAPRAAATNLSGKKIELLESYLGRIRQAADRLSA